MTEAALAGAPEAIRATARELLARAELVRGLAAPAVARLGAAVFEAPAATRLRAQAARSAAGVADAADELAGLAAALLADATSVEAENASLHKAADTVAPPAAPAQDEPTP